MLPNNIQSMKHIELAAYDDLLLHGSVEDFCGRERREYLPGIKEALWCLQVEVSLSEESPLSLVVTIV